MHQAQKILLIFNPKAAHGRSRRALSAIEHHFAQKKIAVTTHVTRRPLDAMTFIAAADFEKYDGIAAAGGDGTLFEVVNGYFQNPGKKKIPLGILPIGTGNSFAKDLELEANDWRRAIDLIILNRPAKVDVARCRSDDAEFYFINIMGLGFPPDVQVVSDKLKFLGNSAYTLGVLTKLLSLKSYPVQLEFDGEQLEREISLLEISNTRYTGRNFLMAPQAKFDDGFLDIIIGGHVRRLKLLALFRKVFSGEHIHAPEVEIFKAKKIRIRSAHPMPLGPDGELHGSTPVDIECLPGAVDIFAR